MGRTRAGSAEYRRRTIVRKNFDHALDAHVRHDMQLQGRRRSVLAMVRNTLVVTALQDEAWVLWIDSDVFEYPPNVLTKYDGCMALFPSHGI